MGVVSTIKNVIKHDFVTEAEQDRVLEAMYQPLRLEDYVPDKWLPNGVEEDDCGDKLLNSVVRLAEYYEDKLPTLSAALRSVWDTLSLVEAGRGFWWNVGLRHKHRNQRRLYTRCKALIVSAAIHYSDGTAQTKHGGFNINSDLDKYRCFCDEAVTNLMPIIEKAQKVKEIRDRR